VAKSEAVVAAAAEQYSVVVISVLQLCLVAAEHDLEATNKTKETEMEWHSQIINNSFNVMFN